MNYKLDSVCELSQQLHEITNKLDNFIKEGQQAEQGEQREPNSITKLTKQVQRSPAELQGVLQRLFEDDNATVAKLLDIISESEFLATVAQADPLAEARLRGIQVQHNLLHDDGPALNSAKVADMLGISRQAVDKRRKQGQLLAVALGKRGYHYPLCQFDRGQVIPGLERVLAALAHCDPWTQLMWLKTGDLRLSGQTPIACLQQGEIDPVLAAAQCYGWPNPA